jgi:arylsulfatase
MEIFAAMVENPDDNVGRLVQHLKDIGEYENTLIVFQSDNGPEASYYEFSGNYDQNYDTKNADPAVYPTLGTPAYKGSGNLDYGQRWAEVSATPFRCGSRSRPRAAIPCRPSSLPGAARQAGAADAFTHVVDLAPTFLDIAGIVSAQHAGRAALRQQGREPQCGQGGVRRPQCLSDHRPVVAADAAGQGNRAGAHHILGRAVRSHLCLCGQLEGRMDRAAVRPGNGEWTLYDIRADRGETNDLATQRPTCWPT